ncbi:MAG: radical SAM protein [Defluviitaleaceae bacterium]|nr:radical SAM protein [Defluviitaleaceae bacterium]
MLREVSLEVIRKCSSNCLHCSSLSNEHCTEILDYEIFPELAGDTVALGGKTICFSGGEPFLHDKISNMIKLTSSLGLQTYVYTCGIVFDEKNNKTSIDKDILKDISPYVTKLIFNIEAATPDIYDKIMGTTGCFEKMKQSICDAHDLGITTEAHFVPMKLNVDEAEAVIDLCNSLNVSKLSFLRLVAHGRAQENEEMILLPDADLELFKTGLDKLSKQSKVEIRIGVPLSANKLQHKCEAAIGKLNIKYDGTVFPCEVFKNDRISRHLKGTVPENIYKKPLREIYLNSTYLNIVRELSKNFQCNDNCETCIGQYLITKEGVM